MSASMTKTFGKYRAYVTSTNVTYGTADEAKYCKTGLDFVSQKRLAVLM